MLSQTFKVDVEATKFALLAQEDTDKDGKITINDTGPKVRLPTKYAKSR